MTQRRGEYTPAGPLTLGDVLLMGANAVRLGYPNESLIDIKTPMVGDRRRVTLTVIDGTTDQLGALPPAVETELSDTATDPEGDADGTQEN